MTEETAMAQAGRTMAKVVFDALNNANHSEESRAMAAAIAAVAKAAEDVLPKFLDLNDYAASATVYTPVDKLRALRDAIKAFGAL